MSADLICGFHLCGDRNYADLFCSECNSRFCFACDPQVHGSGRKQHHSRIPYSQYLQQQQQQQQEEADLQENSSQSPGTSCLVPSTAKRSQRASHPGRQDSCDDVTPLDEEEDQGSEARQASPVAARKKGKKKKQPPPPQPPPQRQPSSNSHSESESASECPLPDVAQMSLEPPTGDEDCDFITADFTDCNKSPRDSGGRQSSSSNHMTVNIMSSKKSVASHSSPSFLVLDKFEQMQVEDSRQFAQKLGCDPDEMVKVVSIFGNTGEGKSHTLNYTFFGGSEVFKTSPAQSSCTIGIWAAYDPKNKVITIDTEGLLGVSENNNRRTRLLLKVLAISDVIIYRTRAERLHNDLFTFLGDASRAYGHHFASELREALSRGGLGYSLMDLGPVVVVFHETLHTDVLRKTLEKSCEDELRRRFQSLGQTTESFSAFEYVGTRTQTPPTSFKSLQEAMRRHLQNTTVRSPRKVSIVFAALKVSTRC